MPGGWISGSHDAKPRGDDGIWSPGFLPKSHQPLLLDACLAYASYGSLAARAIGMPAAFVMGPMILSAAVHLLGWSEARPPAFLIGLAQVVIGSAVGARFSGVAMLTVRLTAFFASGSAAPPSFATALAAKNRRRPATISKV